MILRFSKTSNYLEVGVTRTLLSCNSTTSLVKLIVPCRTCFHHTDTAPNPVFGLEGVCAPARRSVDEGGDRVQRSIGMRGPRAPGEFFFR